MITLEEHNGYLYIVHSGPDLFQPVMRRLWYPIGVRAADFPAHIGQRMRPLGDGLYQPAEGYSPTKYRLAERGRTLPEFSEAEPIPAPKTRVPTRWENGRWEKYLKHKGWVPA